MMGLKMRYLFAFVAACCLVSFAREALAADKIRVAYVSLSPNMSLPWIAKETGMFARHGLDADVILITGSPRLVQSLIAGDVNYAFVGATAVIRARMRGADVTILGSASNISGMKLLVSRKSGIRRLEDLKGRIIGVSQYGSDADAFARMVLGKTGLKPDKDVTLLQLGGHPQVATALVAGKIEAGVLGGLAFLTVQKSGAEVLASGVQLKTLALGGALAASGGYVQRNRDSTMRFMRAIVEAFHYFKTNRDGTVPILQKYMGGITAEQARFLYDDYLDLFEEMPVPREKAIQVILDQESDPKAKSLKPGDFVDLSFLKEIDGSGAVEKVYGR